MVTISRIYQMTDAELITFASHLVVNMTRDTAQFTPRGVTAANITTFGTLVTAFGALPADSFYQADITIAVNTKNTHRQAAEKQIRAIVSCAKIKWGASSPQDKKFAAGMMTKDDDKKFLSTIRQVCITGTTYLSDLTPVGLTAGMITALTTLGDSFQADINNILTAQETRDIKTQERISKGNELYSFVSRYCEIGKIIWQDVDEAKYNDYIIYETSHPILPKPQNLVASELVGPPVKIHLTWDAVLGATNYDVFISLVDLGAPSGDFTFLHNVPVNSFSALAVTGKRNYFKIKARNDTQASNYSDEAWDEA